MAEKLQNLRLQIIEVCNRAIIDDILDDLLQEKVLSHAEVESINEENRSQRNRCRNMVDIVKRKGDKSSNILLRSLQRHEMIRERLRLPAPSNLPVPTQEENKEIHKTSGNTDITDEQHVQDLILCSKKKFHEIQKKEGSDIYTVFPQNKRKRLALIICNVEFKFLGKRNGAEVDTAGMETLLKGLGYHILSETNLTAEEMRQKIKQFAKQEELANSDSTFIVLMSHGVKDGICGVNSEHIQNPNGSETVTDLLHTEEIFKYLNNKNCPKLKDKPKVIIIQACRGDQHGVVFVSDSVANRVDQHSMMLIGDSAAKPVVDQLEDDAMHKVHIESDFICLYSSTPDTVSWRHPSTGSLFIQCLIKNINISAHNSSLLDIFCRIQKSFKNGRQMPTIERTTLLKKFYLFPGQ